MKVKRIRASDGPLISSLFARSGETAGSFNRTFFDHPQNILLAAISEKERPLGYLYGYILDVPHNIRPKAFLYSIDTFPEYRRRKVGTNLMNAFKSVAYDRNCSEVFVLTNAGNLPAMEFFRECGGRRENDDDAMFVFPL